MSVQARRVGEAVEWRTAFVMRGIVIERSTPEESAAVDALMRRPSGSGWQEFGAMLGIRCTDPDCVCQPEVQAGRTGWYGFLHRVSESQVVGVLAALERTLW